MSDRTTAPPTLDDHLDATRDTRLASLREFLRIPSISALPEHAADCPARRRLAGRRPPSGRGREHVEVTETSGHPVVYGDWLHAEGAPTVIVYGHYDVQPVDPLDEWTQPAVRAGRRWRPDPRPRRRRRQGPDPCARRRRRRAPRDTRSLPDQRQVRLRGRGGEFERAARRMADSQPRPPRGRRRDHQRHGLLRRQPPSDHGRPAGADVRADRRRAVAGRPPLGELRGCRQQPGDRARPDHRGAQGPGRSHPHPRLLRRRARAD